MNWKIRKLLEIYGHFPEAFRIINKFELTKEFIEELANEKNIISNPERIRLAYSCSLMNKFIGIKVEEELIKAATEEMLRQFNIEKA
jgi:hypothetical protein